MNINEQEARKTMEEIQSYCKNNPDFTIKLVEAEDITAFGKELMDAGFTLDEAGIEALFNSIRKEKENDALSDEQLENVSGGFILTGYALALATWALCAAGAGAFIYGFYKGLHS